MRNTNTFGNTMNIKETRNFQAGSNISNVYEYLKSCTGYNGANIDLLRWFLNNWGTLNEKLTPIWGMKHIMQEIMPMRNGRFP